MSKKDPAPEETSTEPEKPTKEEAKPEDIEEPHH
jgi:hypothetical protein